MRPSVGYVARPPFLSFITPLRFDSFLPRSRSATDRSARSWDHSRHEYCTRVSPQFQTPFPINVPCIEKDRCLQKPGARLSFKAVIRKSSSTGRGDDTRHAPRTDLPSQEEGRRSHISKSFTRVMDHLQSNIFIAGQRLNDLTGYSGIEALRRDIERQEIDVQECRSSLQKAREAYSSAISQRSASQREVNELLQRKHAWTPNDLERFTALYRSDHANEQSESSAQERLAAAERRAEEATAKLSASILARYHEEQIWSDKIRRMSTWGTWGLMGVNVLLFLVFQIGVEPWRRKRLVKGFEDKVMEALEREAPFGAVKLTTTSTSTISPPTSSPELALETTPPPSATRLTQNGESPPAPNLSSPPPPTENSIAELSQRSTQSLSLEVASLPNLVTPPPVLHDASLPSFDSPTRAMIAIKDVLRDLFSARTVLVRRVDLTTIALEGAAAGMALAGILTMVFLRMRWASSQ